MVEGGTTVAKEKEALMDNTKPWKVVELPTALGTVCGWHNSKVLKQFERKEDADEYAHLEYADDPAPDKADYYQLKVIHYVK